MRKSNVAAEAPAGASFIPPFIRFPKHGEKDPICGLSRTTLIKVIKELGVKTISVPTTRTSSVARQLKGSKAVRGARMIDVQDLIAKIRAQGGVVE